MTTSVNQTITSTGAGTAIDAGAPTVLSFVLNSDTTPVATVEVLLTPAGTWSNSGAVVTIGTVESTIGPVVGIRLNVSDLNSATATNFEVVGISR